MSGCKNNEVKKRNFFCNSSNMKPRKKTSSGKASYINAVIVLIKTEITTLVVKFILRFSIPPNKWAVKIPSPSNIKGKTIPIAIFVDEFTPFKPIFLRDPGLFLFRIYNTMSVNPVKIHPCISVFKNMLQINPEYQEKKVRMMLKANLPKLNYWQRKSSHKK